MPRRDLEQRRGVIPDRHGNVEEAEEDEELERFVIVLYDLDHPLDRL